MHAAQNVRKNHGDSLVRYGRSAALESAGRQADEEKEDYYCYLPARKALAAVCGLIHHKNKWGSESKEYIERSIETRFMPSSD